MGRAARSGRAGGVEVGADGVVDLERQGGCLTDVELRMVDQSPDLFRHLAHCGGQGRVTRLFAVELELRDDAAVTVRAGRDDAGHDRVVHQRMGVGVAREL